MTGHRLSGHVNERHELIIQVPDSIPPGPVQVMIVSEPVVVEGDDEWSAGVALEWAAELSDSREDIYSLDDGEPLDAA